MWMKHVAIVAHIAGYGPHRRDYLNVVERFVRNVIGERPNADLDQLVAECCNRHASILFERTVAHNGCPLCELLEDRKQMIYDLTQLLKDYDD